MGSWSDPLTTPCNLDGILTDGDSLFQYKVLFTTSDPDSTPVLDDITVTWGMLGIEHESDAGSSVLSLHRVQPNPAFGHASLTFTLPVNSRAELTVFDLTGHVVHSISGEYEPGVHEIRLDDLDSGVYLVRMSSGDFIDTQRFVMID